MAERDKFILFFLLLFFTAIPLKLFSQTINGIGANVGFNITNIRDVNMSPLLYSGVGFSGGIIYQRNTDIKSKLFQINYHRAELSNQPGNIANYNGITSKNFTFYHRGTPSDKLINIGWANNNVIALYDEISYGNYGNRTYYFTSFGPAVLVNYALNLGEKAVILRLRADAQLLGFYLRPSYISSAFEGFLDQDNTYFQAFFRSIEVFTPSRSVNLGYSPGILYEIGSSVDVAFEYNYEFTRIKIPEPVSSSIGNWYFRLTMWL